MPQRAVRISKARDLWSETTTLASATTGTAASASGFAAAGGVPTPKQAERIVGWCDVTWGPEEYFRLLKMGTRIYDR